MPQTTGIHHVTAISGGPQRNVDFYAGTLGLRLVKKTVNFDDPETYHLYYGDEAGSPGTIMTSWLLDGAPHKEGCPLRETPRPLWRYSSLFRGP